MDDDNKREDDVNLSDSDLDDMLGEEGDDDENDAEDPVDEMDAFGVDHESNEKQWE
jgi:hypothetical protein